MEAFRSELSAVFFGPHPQGSFLKLIYPSAMPLRIPQGDNMEPSDVCIRMTGPTSPPLLIILFVGLKLNRYKALKPEKSVQDEANRK